MKRARPNIFIALLVTLLSFIILYTEGQHLAGLVVGVVLLDIGVQAGHISNQIRIYNLVPEARSRLNMVYMITYFTAGAIGSYLGTILWQHFAWPGVCGYGCLLPAIGCGIHVVTGRQKRS